jgi:hypothetical protein
VCARRTGRNFDGRYRLATDGWLFCAEALCDNAGNISRLALVALNSVLASAFVQAKA